MDESIEEEGCRGTLRRETVEDNESEGVGRGESDGPPSRGEGRKC